jgi:hypothetical protein
MQVKTRLLMATLATLCLCANAQDRILGPSPSTRTAWDLFAEPGASTPSRQVAVGELPTPLTIQESKASHHRIDLQGQAYWIKGSQVRVARGNTASCKPTAAAKLGTTIATPGAGKDGC